MDSEGSSSEVTGHVAEATVASMRTAVADLAPEPRQAVRRAWAAHDIESDDEWVPLAAVCEALGDVVDAVGSGAVVELGREVGTAVDLPADCDTVPAALAALDGAYHDRHRGDAGGYRFRRIGERDGRVECETPYPCAFDRGFVAGVASARAECPVRVSEVGACHEGDAPRCTYELRW